MNHTLIASLFTLSCLSAVQGRVASAQHSADEDLIRAVIQAHANAWNQRDAKAAASVYTQDAVIRTSSGQLLTGRAAIEQAHREWLAEDTASGGSIHSHPLETIKIRFLRPDVATADLDGCMTPRASAGQSTSAADCVPLFIILIKREGRWQVTEQRALLRGRT
ncbi:MAG TPA: SgcJ/EcaC family oxidoreductase [Gemmatimonadales bacterium]|nr:SgcJ/EcaC family oxidoreductase [Gemmatimonadales bacterium]